VEQGFNLEHQSWCFNNGIKIYIVPIGQHIYIEINDNGNITRSTKTYKNQKIASNKIWELYSFLYSRYCEN